MTDLSQLSDEDFNALGAKLSSGQTNPDQVPDLSNMSDEDFEALGKQLAPKPSIQSPLSAIAPIPQSVADTTSDFLAAVRHGVPGSGLAQKAGQAFAAGMGSITPDALLAPEYRGKSFQELYDMQQAMNDAEDKMRQERSPEATTVGNVMGAFTAPMPAVGAEASMAAKVGTAAARVGINTADVASKQPTLDKAEDAAKNTALLSAAAESLLPGAGKIMQGLASKNAEAIANTTAQAGGLSGRDLLENNLVPWDVSKKTGAQGIANKISNFVDELSDAVKAAKEAQGGELTARQQGLVDDLMERLNKVQKVQESAQEAAKTNTPLTPLNIIGLIEGVQHPYTVGAATVAKMAAETPAGANAMYKTGKLLNDNYYTTLRSIATRKAGEKIEGD